MHDSATRDRAHRRPAQQRRDLLVDRRAVLGEQRVARGARATSSTKRVVGVLAAGLVARRDLDLAAAQAGRDLERASRSTPVALGDAQRLGDLRLGDPEQPQRSPARTSVAPRERRAQRRRSARAVRPHRLQLARRPGQHDHRRAVRRRPAARRPARARSRPARAPSRPRGHRLLAVAARASPRGRGSASAPASGARISAIRSSSASSSTSSRPCEAADDLGGEVVGGRPEAAAGDDQVHPLGGQEAQRRRACPRGRSPTIVDVRERRRPSSRRRSDSHGPLRSVMTPGEHLGARDDDARRATLTCRSAARSAGSGCAPRARRDRVADRGRWTRAPAAVLPSTRICTALLPSVISKRCALVGRPCSARLRVSAGDQPAARRRRPGRRRPAPVGDEPTARTSRAAARRVVARAPAARRRAWPRRRGRRRARPVRPPASPSRRASPTIAQQRRSATSDDADDRQRGATRGAARRPPARRRVAAALRRGRSASAPARSAARGAAGTPRRAACRRARGVARRCAGSS